MPSNHSKSAISLWKATPSSKNLLKSRKLEWKWRGGCENSWSISVISSPAGQITTRFVLENLLAWRERVEKERDSLAMESDRYRYETERAIHKAFCDALREKVSGLVGPKACLQLCYQSRIDWIFFQCPCSYFCCYSDFHGWLWWFSSGCSYSFAWCSNLSWEIGTSTLFNLFPPL